MISFRPEGLKNPKGAEQSAPFLHTTEYTEHLEQRSRSQMQNQKETATKSCRLLKACAP
jgi:hypothetical protein